MSVVDVLLSILIVIAIIVGIYLIFALRKVINTLFQVQKDLSNLNDRLEPILNNLTIITDKIVNISEETEKGISDISNTIQNVRNTFSKFSFKGINSFKINPAKDLFRNLRAFSRGFSAFWKKLNN